MDQTLDFEAIFQINQFAQLIKIQQYPQFPQEKIPYLNLMSEIQSNQSMDPIVIFKSFLNKYKINPLEYQIDNDLVLFLKTIQQRTVDQKIQSVLVNYLPMNEEFQFDLDNEVNQLIKNIQKSGINGVLEYSEDNLSPDIYEDFEESLKQAAKFTTLIKFMVETIQLTIRPESGSIEASLASKAPHSVQVSQHVAQIEIPIIMNLKELHVFFDQIFAEQKIRVKIDANYDDFLNKFLQDIGDNFEQLGGQGAVRIAAKNFSAKKIAKKNQEMFTDLVVERYPYQTQPSNQQQSQVQSGLQQSSIMRMSSTKNNPNLIENKSLLEEQGEKDYIELQKNNNKEREEFEVLYGKKCLQDSDNEENLQMSKIQAQTKLPGLKMTDEEKKKKKKTKFAFCGGGKKQEGIQRNPDVDRFPDEWKLLQPNQIINIKYVKQSDDWLQVLQKWCDYFDNQEVQSTEVTFQYLDEMRLLIDQFRYKEKSKCQFLLVGQLKERSKHNKQLSEFLGECLREGLYIRNEKNYDLYKVMPILIKDLNNRKMAESLVLDNLLNYKFQNLLDQTAFTGHDDALLSCYIYDILSKNTQQKMEKPELLVYSEFYQKDKLYYKILKYLIENKMLQKTQSQYLYYFEELLIKNPLAATNFIGYNLHVDKAKFKPYFQQILTYESFNIPNIIQDLFMTYPLIKDNFQMPQIILFKDSYGGIGDQSFQILKKMIICQERLNQNHNEVQYFSLLCRTYEECLVNQYNLALNFYLNSPTYRLWPKIFNTISLDQPELIQKLIHDLKIQMRLPEMVQYIPYFKQEDQQKREIFDCCRNILYAKQLMMENPPQSQIYGAAYEAYCYYFKKLLITHQDIANLIIQNSYADLDIYERLLEDLSMVIPKVLNQFIDKYQILPVLNLRNKPELLQYEQFFQKIKEPVAEILVNLIFLKKQMLRTKMKSSQFNENIINLARQKLIAAIQFVSLNKQESFWPDVFKATSQIAPIETDNILKQFSNYFEKPTVLNYTALYNDNGQLVQDKFLFCQQLINYPQQEPQLQQFLFQNLKTQNWQICAAYVAYNNYPNAQALVDQLSTEEPERTAEFCKELQKYDFRKVKFPEIILYTSHINAEFTKESLQKSLLKQEKISQKIKKNKSLDENKEKLFKKLLKKLKDPNTRGFALEWILNNEFPNQISYQELLDKCAVESLESVQVAKTLHKSLQDSYITKQKSQIRMGSSLLQSGEINQTQLSQNLDYLDKLSQQLQMPDIVEIIEENCVRDEKVFKILAELQGLKNEYSQNKEVEEVKDRYFKKLISALENEQTRQTTVMFLQRQFESNELRIPQQNEFLRKMTYHSLPMLQYTPSFYGNVCQDEIGSERPSYRSQASLGGGNNNNTQNRLNMPELVSYIPELGNDFQLYVAAKELLTKRSQQNVQNPSKQPILQALQSVANSQPLIEKFLKVSYHNKAINEDNIQEILEEIAEMNLNCAVIAQKMYNNVKQGIGGGKQKIFASVTEKSSIKEQKLKTPEMVEYLEDIKNQQQLFDVVKELIKMKKQCMDMRGSYDLQKNREQLDQKILYETSKPQNVAVVFKFLERNSQNFDWSDLLEKMSEKAPKNAYQAFQIIRQTNPNIKPPEILEFLPYYDQDPLLQEKISSLLRLRKNEQTYSEYEQKLQEFSQENYEVYRKLVQKQSKFSGQQSSARFASNQGVVFMPNFDIQESLEQMNNFYYRFKFCTEKMSQNILKIDPKLIFCPGRDLKTQKGCGKSFTNINNLSFLKCPVCQLNFCTYCYQPNHEGLTCDSNYEKLDSTQKQQFQRECMRQKQLQQSEIEFKKKKEISDWILDKKDFSSLKIIFFNLLNRGDDWENIIKLINSEIKAHNIFLPFSFNKKLLFYLYLQNSDEIRQYKSIEQHSRYSDVPLFYPKWPSSSQQDKFLTSMTSIKQSEMDNSKNECLFKEYTINSTIYLITKPSTSIVSFGLNKAALYPTGKSSILNYVFSKNFQTEDRSPFSARTIDIDFDNSFRPTRSFAIADVNGEFEKKHYKPFFNLFQFIMIHVKYQDLNSDSEKYKEILGHLSQSPLKPFLFIMVRDFPRNQIYDRNYFDSDQDRIWSILDKTGAEVFKQYQNKQVFIMENMDKISLKEEKTGVLDQLQNTIFKNLQKISDKRALDKNSILQFFKHYNEAVEITHIDEIKNNVMQELYKYQDDFFDEHIFPCRNLMKKIKDTKKLIWKGTNKQQIANNQMKLKQLTSQLQNADLSGIMKVFLQQVISSPKWYQIIIDLSREISQFSEQKLIQLKREKEKIQKEYEEILNKANDEMNNQNYMKDRIRIENEKNRANERVEQQIISIEIFWRELFSLLEVNYQALADSQIDPLERMFDFSGYGESFEIIDGDNMQVNKQQLSQLADKFKQSRILVLSILGPQSSGKSTLLNYLFGCQFSSSVGRCTRGVYGSLVKVDRDHLNKILSDLQFQGVERKNIDEKSFDYLLVLDTEGLQDPAKPNTEFDRTITLFCFSVSQILLINFKGEISRDMKKLLEICVYSLHTLRKTRIIGNEVFMVFNQNAHVNEITALKDQITDMKSNIIEANTQAAQEAELLCSGRDGQVVALGSAFKEDQFQPNEYIWQQWKKKNPQSSFAMDCASLAENIFGGFLRQRAEWNFSSWLKMAQGIWNFIELYPGLLEFEDIMQLKQENDFREAIELQKKEYLDRRPADVVQQQIREQKEKMKKTNLVEIYENVKSYIGGLYNEIQVKIENNMTQFCEERNFDVKLLQNKLQQVKDFIANQEKEAMFHLSDYLQKGKTNSYKKEGIVTINEQIKQYQQNFPYQEIDQFLVKKYNRTRNDLTQDQYNQIIQEWAEFKFEELWVRIIDDLEGKLNLEENCYDLIYNHLEEFYKKKEKNIVTTHFKHRVKDILLKEKEQKLSINSLHELQDYYIKNIVKDKNQIIFKKKITDKFDQNLNLILRQLDIHGNFLNLKQIFRIKVQKRYIDRTQIHKAFSQKKLKELIQKKCGTISINSTQKVKERVGDELIVEIQGILYAMGLCLDTQTEQKIQAIFKQKYLTESSRAGDIYQLCIFNGYLRASISETSQGFSYKDLKRNYVTYSYFPEFEKYVGVNEWEYNNIDQASEFQKQRAEQVQKLQFQNLNLLFDSEEQWVYIDTFEPYQKKQYEQGIEFLITKDMGLGTKQEIYQQLANLARDYLKWEDITEEIWTMLEEKLCLPNSGEGRSSNQEGQWQDISKFSSETVESAFQQVEHIIEKANKDLEYIGQELDQLGQILVHYFGMVICWKILCYSYMNIYLQPIRDLEADKQQWKTTFISQICSDSTKISENLAARIAKDYIRHIKQICKQQMFTQEFFQENFSHLKSVFTSQNIMYKTDKQIFNLKIDRNDDNFQEIFENQIIAYTKDPKPFLEVVFEQEWKKATEKQISHSKQQYSQQVQAVLKNAEVIVDELIGIFYRMQYKRKQGAKEFFKCQATGSVGAQQMEDMYKMAAFHYLKDIFDGKNSKNWSFKMSTEEGYSFVFSPQNTSVQIAVQEVELFSSVQWTNQESNLQVIPFPVYFLECLLDEIKKFSESVDITYHDLGIADIYTDSRTQSIGCLKQCNFCGRKCDKPVQIEHKHACSKSHQVRGMKGVKYGKTLSNKICDEIKMDQVIHVENNGKITKVKWGDICKTSCPDWIFMKENQNEEGETEISEKDQYDINFTDVWNKYAEFFCNYYRNFYQEELNYNFITVTQKFHYLILMDDSGSMYGEKWNNAKLACINFIRDSQKYHKNANIEAKVSVIKFSNQASLVYGPEELDPQICEDKLNFEGGGTDFYEPLHIAIDQIHKYRDTFNRHIVMFYTDGYAKYPAQLRIELNNLPKEVYQQIEFKSWSEQEANVLADIAKLFVVGEAQDNVKTHELQSAFCEILNAVQHGIAF